MSILSGHTDFFGLDIGTSAIRAVQLSGTGPIKSLARYAYVPLSDNLAISDSPADRDRLAKTIEALVNKAGFSTKHVAVGLPSQRVFTTLFDTDRLPEKELAKAIKFQADSIIPTPMADSMIDWQLLGNSPVDQTKVEILLSSVTNEYLEGQLDLLESIGLNIIAFEPDLLAICRALIAPGSQQTELIIDIGSKSSDLVITLNGAPRLARSIPTGSEAIINAAMQNLNIDAGQAEQFVYKFGLIKDKLEGQIYQAISGTIDTLVSEIEKSIKFFYNRYQNTKLDHIIVSGIAAILPDFPVYIANKFGLNVEIGNAWRNIAYDPTRQNELLAISSQFPVAAGLAERNG